MKVYYKAQVANAREDEEKQMSNENETQGEANAVPEPHPANRIYVGRRNTFSTSWTEHEGTFDQVVETMRQRALDGKANSEGFEVVEMAVARSAIVKPVITATEVTEQGASA